MMWLEEEENYLSSFSIFLIVTVDIHNNKYDFCKSLENSYCEVKENTISTGLVAPSCISLGGREKQTGIGSGLSQGCLSQRTHECRKG